MSSFSFDRDNSLYKNRDALLEEYTPDNLVGRDEELEEYHAALQPIINGEAPSNIFLYGKSGVGKTAATRFLLNRLQDDAAKYDDISLNVIEINCDGLNSSYQVAVRLVNTLRDPSEQISNTGYPQAQVYSFLWEELDKIGGTVIVVLDEVDHINDNSILYQIPRARSNGYLEDAKIGLIGISNDLSFRDSLSAKVRSSLCEKEVSFPPYDATELQKVLSQREQVAFHDGALAEDVIPLCAAYGAQDAGDARQALDLLLEAGDLARKEAVEQVTDDHVQEAREKLERDRIMEGVADLTEHARLVLYALTSLEAEDETPARSRDIRPRYEQLCNHVGTEPLTSRRMRDHLADLAMLGVISSTEKNEGMSGGKYRKHALKQDLQLVVTALEDTIEFAGVHESIRPYYQTTFEDAES
ncbi:orc1/cdc6 family replication initiation protein (plasmid) [Halorussus limi]|uniref:ORC1-type DNA replication protein n=1 Tax=Halorussus limi TaxID=2938695 RepID=A0A8U0I0D4_9EURY|nr:orc1/cdc6 family replication initiation protein [Halorussus limi]UPV76386.1 orc1/cdc6 family replication initiation protein [Halorussus limi]